MEQPRRDGLFAIWQVSALSSPCGRPCRLQKRQEDSANAEDVKTYMLHVPYSRFNQESGKREAGQGFVAAIQPFLTEVTTPTILLCIFISIDV